MEAPRPPDEAARLQTLRDYRILDTPPEAAFDDAAFVARELCDAPAALVTLVDEARQWFKARLGVEVRETPRAQSICAHAVLRPREVLVIPDTSKDPRTADNPQVAGPPGWRFYAGAPLVAPDGRAVGTLCVLDTRPRELSVDQARALQALARRVVVEMELRRTLAEVEDVAEGRKRRAASGAVAAAAAPVKGRLGTVPGWGAFPHREGPVISEPIETPGGAYADTEMESRVTDLVQRLKRLKMLADEAAKTYE